MTVELIKKFQQEYQTRGNYNNYYEQLEKQFEPLLKAAVHHYRGLDHQDDLLQVVRLSFFRGLLDYRCDGVVYFEYYIKRKVYGDLRTHTRRVMGVREREQVFNQTDSHQDITIMKKRNNANSEISNGIGNGISDDIGSNLIWDDMLNSLSLTNRERQIIQLIYKHQYRQAEVARLLNVDPSTIRKTHMRAIKKSIMFMTLIPLKSSQIV
jgi:RNA polymerase sigma factor (sigma-70 family)